MPLLILLQRIVDEVECIPTSRFIPCASVWINRPGVTGRQVEVVIGSVGSAAIGGERTGS